MATRRQWRQIEVAAARNSQKKQCRVGYTTLPKKTLARTSANLVVPARRPCDTHGVAGPKRLQQGTEKEKKKRRKEGKGLERLLTHD